MPVERRDIGGTIGGGNFGSRGTPLGYSAPRKGPDLGRLVNALGSLGKHLKDDAQEEENKVASEAELETRRAILENMRPLKDESDIDHKKRISTAVGEVRNKYANRDRSVTSELLLKDDLALKAIDRVQTESRAHRIRNEISLLRKNNPNMSTEEFMEQVDSLMNDGFAGLSHVSKNDKIAFLKEVNSHALNEIGIMSAIGEKNFQERGLQELEGSSFELTLDKLGTALGVSAEQANDSLDKYKEFHTNFSFNEKELLPQLSDNMQDVYNKALAITGGDKKRSQDQALAYAVSIAKTTGRPEILDHLANTKIDGSGTKLNRYYAKQVLAIKEDIAKQAVVTRDYLTKKENQRIYEGNKQQIDSAFVEYQSMLNKVATDPHNFDTLTEANKTLKDHRQKIFDDFNAGRFRGNEGQAGDMLKLLNAMENTLNAKEGNLDSVTAFRVGMFNGDWTIDDHNKYAPGLTKADAAKSFEFIKPQIMAKDEATKAHLANLAFKRKAALNRPAVDFMQKFDTWYESNKTRIKAFEAIPENSEIYKALGHRFNVADVKDLRQRMQGELQEVALELSEKTWNEEQRPPTVEEYHEQGKSVIEKYQKYLDGKTKEFDEYDKAYKTGGALTGETPEGKAIQDSLEKASKNPFGRAVELSTEDVNNIYEGARLRVASPDQVKVALVQDLKNNAPKLNKLSDVIQFVADRYAFNVKDEQSMSFMREVLGRAFEGAEQEMVDYQAMLPGVVPEGGKITGGTKLPGGGFLDMEVDTTNADFRTKTKPGSYELGDETFGKALGDLFFSEDIFSEKGIRAFLGKYPMNVPVEQRDAEVKRILEILKSTKDKADAAMSASEKAKQGSFSYGVFDKK